MLFRSELLSLGSAGVVWERFDVCGEVLDPRDLMPGQENTTELREIEPLVGSTLYAAEIEVERVNVNKGLHCRAPKKQEPLPKERPRALLENQSGVMMSIFLTDDALVVKVMTSSQTLNRCCFRYFTGTNHHAPLGFGE